MFTHPYLCTVKASLNFAIPEIEALVAALPEAPILAREECLTRCGLIRA